MSRHITLGFGLLVCLLAIGGCGNRDPYRRTDVWKPTGANAANLAAMVANPQDLIRGHGVNRYDTKASELAVELVWTDRPKSLTGGSGGSGGGASPGSGAGGAGGGSGGAGGTPGS